MIESGQRFGKLTVLGSAGGRRWHVRCDCGAEKEVAGKHLRPDGSSPSGTRSCGCLRRGIAALDGLTAQQRWISRHPEKRRAIARTYYHKNREEVLANHRRYHDERPYLRRAWRYRIAPEVLARLEAEHDGKCGACGRAPTGTGRTAKLCIDHDHATGKVRGLLCHPCNLALGYVEDDVERLEALARYVRAASGA